MPVKHENRIDRAVKEGVLFLNQNPDMHLVFVRDQKGVRPIGTDAAILTVEMARRAKFDPDARSAVLSNLFEAAKSTGRQVDITETDKGHTVVIGPVNRTLAYGNG